MLVRLLTDRVNSIGHYQRIGEVFELPDSEALTLVKTKLAELVEPETASEIAPENAALKPGRPKRRQQSRSRK